MRIVDRALPAIQHLVGATAIEVLRVPVEAVGGIIESVHPVHVQYRPGSDAVVRYSAMVSWGGAPPTRETLVASSMAHGSYAGAVAVTASTSEGPLEVGLWRWPFDPVLSGLGSVVTASDVAALLDVDALRIVLEVVSYRPTERAVVRVSTDSGEVISYIKVVAPTSVREIERRHRILLGAGVPVPAITMSDPQTGLLVLEPLAGPTLRDLIKSDSGPWVEAAEFDRLADGFARAELTTTPLTSRLDDAILHAQMLGRTVPRARSRLNALAARFEAAPRPAIDGAVHGDLHEAQLVVNSGNVVGVLDIDDAGPGSAVDDRANLIARLLFRTIVDQRSSRRLIQYAERLRADSASRFDQMQLDLHISAAMVGLATGPFRMQSNGWQDDVVALVDAASMRGLSATSHEGLTTLCT